MLKLDALFPSRNHLRVPACVNSSTTMIRSGEPGAAVVASRAQNCDHRERKKHRSRLTDHFRPRDCHAGGTAARLTVTELIAKLLSSAHRYVK